MIQLPESDPSTFHVYSEFVCKTVERQYPHIHEKLESVCLHLQQDTIITHPSDHWFITILLPYYLKVSRVFLLSNGPKLMSRFSGIDTELFQKGIFPAGTSAQATRPLGFMTFVTSRGNIKYPDPNAEWIVAPFSQHVKISETWPDATELLILNNPHKKWSSTNINAKRVISVQSMGVGANV